MKSQRQFSKKQEKIESYFHLGYLLGAFTVLFWKWLIKGWWWLVRWHNWLERRWAEGDIGFKLDVFTVVFVLLIIIGAFCYKLYKVGGNHPHFML